MTSTNEYLRLVNGIARMTLSPVAAEIYSQTVTVGVGGVTTGVDITLPASGSYLGAELEVYLNGEYMELGLDFNTSGSSPYTKIQMTFDLVQGDKLRFRKI